jgi:hypothetical protein
MILCSKLFESGADATDLSSKAHQSTSVILFIADSIRAILSLCEPSISFIRATIAATTKALSEVQMGPLHPRDILIGLRHRLHEWQAAIPT